MADSSSIESCYTFNVLGTEWTLIVGNAEKFPVLEENDGVTDCTTKIILINDMVNYNEVDTKGNLCAYRRTILTHELIHAFLEESGLSYNTSTICHWALNDEMVDWFAIQFSKIQAVRTYLFEMLDIVEYESNAEEVGSIINATARLDK